MRETFQIETAWRMQASLEAANATQQGKTAPTHVPVPDVPGVPAKLWLWACWIWFTSQQLPACLQVWLLG